MCHHGTYDVTLRASDVYMCTHVIAVVQGNLCNPNATLKQGYNHSTLPKKSDKFARLTLASEGSGSLVKPQQVYGHLHLRSCCIEGCRMSENMR